MTLTRSPGALRRTARRGFTPIDLVIVIVVLGILAAVVISALGAVSSARPANLLAPVVRAARLDCRYLTPSTDHAGTASACSIDVSTALSPENSYPSISGSDVKHLVSDVHNCYVLAQPARPLAFAACLDPLAHQILSAP